MALPNHPITPIPNNEPDAVPALWNTRYEEIDQNFSDLDQRVTDNTDELEQARGGESSLNERIDGLESQVNVQSAEFQNTETAAVMFALSQAALANKTAAALREHMQQEAEIVIQNRGIVTGCSITKSSSAARNLNLLAGRCFAHGRTYSVYAGDNVASVPPNVGTEPEVVHAYLRLDVNDQWRLSVTAIGQSVPDDGIRIYTLTIPANSTDATDPQLDNVSMTDVRRIESNFPAVLDNPASVSPAIEVLSANDWRIDFDVVASEGAPCDPRCILVSSRAPNGMTLQLASAADNVRLRYRISKLNN